MKKTKLVTAFTVGLSAILTGCGGDDGDGGGDLIPKPALNQATGHTIVTEKTGDFDIRMSLTASVPGNNGHPRVIAHRTEEWVDDHNESYAFFPFYPAKKVKKDNIKNEFNLSFKMDSKPAKFIISWFDEDTGERLTWFDGRGTTHRSRPGPDGTYSFGNSKKTGMGLDPRIYIASCEETYPDSTDCYLATGNGIMFQLWGNVDGERDGQPIVSNFPIQSNTGSSDSWYDLPARYRTYDAKMYGRIFKNDKDLNLTLKVSLCDDSGKCDFATLERIVAKATYNPQ